MLRFLMQRLVGILVVLFGVSALAFGLMHAIPGSPWDSSPGAQKMMSNISMDASTKARLNQYFGLDLPLWRQYTRYMFGDFDANGDFTCGAICGNLGPSQRQRGRSVQDILFSIPEGKGRWDSRFGYTLRLATLSFGMAVLLGVPLGILAAMRQRSRIDRGISMLLAGAVSIPNFVLGLLAILLLASGLGLITVLPDWDRPSDWVVPALVLAVAPMANLARLTRTAMLDAMRGDYVRTARAKGLTRSRTILVHVLRNALIPIITFIGPTLMELIAGSFIVEALFGFPGFGREYWTAIVALDYPMVLGLTILYATGIVLISLFVDALYGLIDPRVRSGQKGGAA